MDPGRYRVVDVAEKAQRFANFHHNTLKVVGEMIGAAGISHPVHLTRRHIVRRLSSSEIRLADQIFPMWSQARCLLASQLRILDSTSIGTKSAATASIFEGQLPG